MNARASCLEPKHAVDSLLVPLHGGLFRASFEMLGGTGYSARAPEASFCVMRIHFSTNTGSGKYFKNR